MRSEPRSDLVYACGPSGSQDLIHRLEGLVTLEIVSSTNSQTRLVVTGAAKEGIIKQNTAQKAVSRVVEALASKFKTAVVTGHEGPHRRRRRGLPYRPS